MQNYNGGQKERQSKIRDEEKVLMGELKKWRDQKWVRIGTDGSNLGACGTSKKKRTLTDVLPLAKARSMSKAERAKTARKKKEQEQKEKQL